jgi:hypothetical protein
MPMTKKGGHTRTTSEDTVELVRRLARDYDDRTIAAILAKQRRRTPTGLPFSRARVATLRANYGIPAHTPTAAVGPDDQDAVVVTISAAEEILGVGKVTLYGWLRDGFIIGEQITLDRRVGNYVIADPSNLGNFMIADNQLTVLQRCTRGRG